jgi:hypothetical protein
MELRARRGAAVAVLLLCPALLGATPTPVPGGATQRQAVEGCMNQWLFDGVWRFRVTKVEPINPDGLRPGYGVAVEFRNGTRATLTPVFAGADAQAIQLQLEDGNTLDAKATTAAALIAQKITYKELIQAAGVAVALQFLGDAMAKPESLKKPVKLVFPIDPKMERAHPNLPQYASGDPSFRVDLTCDKAKTS